MKRFYTLLILLVGVLSTLLAHDAEVNGIYYNLDTTNKTAEVTYRGEGYKSYDSEYSGSVNIPASITYNGVSYKVLSIGDDAFHGCVNMTSIKIAEGIQEIGDDAFQGCASLTSIEFPNSVTTIGSSVFATYLLSDYPDVILRHITLGSGLTKVGTDAFGYDSGAGSSLDEGAEVHYKGTADSWAKINFENKYANPLHDATDLYINGELLTEANITSATSISAYAFINCTSLTSVKMGSSVQKIGVEAFKGCNNLKYITSYPTTVPTVYSTSFSNYNAYLYVPCASKVDYDLHNIFGSFKYVECVTDEEGDNNGGDSGTTPTPTPDPNVAPLYIKLALNNWEANDTYKLTSADGNYYVANYSAGNEITISGNFKISNEDWSLNYGGAFIVEAGKSYTLAAGGANLDTAGKIKASKVEFTLSTGVLKITGTTSSNEFDTTKDQGVAFVVNPRGTSPVFVPLTHSYNAEYQTAQYTGTYTVTELGVTAKIGGLTNFNVIDYGTNGQPVMPKFIYDMVKGAYEGFTIEGDYKVGDVLNILVFFDKDWNSSILINVQEAGTNPTPDPTPDPEPDPTPGGEITLYYVNKTGWSAVNAYVWDFATGTPIAAWSGEPATKLDKTVDGYDVYSYTFDSSLADRIIFNNGNGGEGNQTQDLTFEASKPYFYDGVWYETLTFDTNGGGTVDPTPDPEPEPEPDPTVPAFIVAGNGGSDATGIWCNGIEWNPSAEANRMKDADKDGIFEITYSNVPAGTWSFKVVVNTEPVQWLGGEFLDAKNSSAGYTIQDGGNIGFSLSNAADVTIKIDSADGKITLTTPSGNFGKVKIDYFSVANSDECLVENRFTAANNNTLKYTENIQILEGNEYGYAVYRILGNCNYAVYEKNLLVEVTEAGIYDITIVFNGDYDNPDFTITAVKQGGTIDPDPVVAIKNLMLQPFEQILPNTTTSTVATFTLQNANTATVSIEGLDADFFEIGEQNIGNGECSISIVFKPIVKGVYYATLVVTTDDEVSLSIDFAAVCGDETFEPGDVPELNPDPVNPGTPDDDINVSVEEVSAIMIYAKEGTIYSEVEFEIYDLAGVNVTKLNGSLQGVYIVKTADGNRLVSVW
ncbi:MAG: leucine-rich repeat protein [Paludibacteraceae bacterium]|nr:leucine-rich repeat protein [Paludibacteraceae bacterium]